MLDQVIRNGVPSISESGQRPIQINCVPESDSGYHQIETAGPMVLMLESPIPHLAQPVEEHRSGQGISGLPFVEADMHPPAQV